MSLGLYGVFPAIQNLRHRDYFLAPKRSGRAFPRQPQRDGAPAKPLWAHGALLLGYLVPLVLLAEYAAVPIDYFLHQWQAPPALGGVLVAAMVPARILCAVRAALANQLQRSVNILLGSVLASIGLTIPAVLTIGFLRGSTIILGPDEVDTTPSSSRSSSAC
ncbi:MAG: hypothetical protein U0361_20455 [Nitrospiraceae bacterium]